MIPEEKIDLLEASKESAAKLSEAAGALAKTIEAIAEYVPTVWVDNSEPDIDAEKLNHIEEGIKSATEAVNSAIGSIAQLNSDLAGLEIGVRPVGADCNSMINCLLIAQNPQNGPGTGWWLIMSTGDSNTRKQIAYDLNGDNVAVTRRYAGGISNDWTPVKSTLDWHFPAKEALLLSNPEKLGYSELLKNSNAQGDYGTIIMDARNDGSRTELVVDQYGVHVAKINPNGTLDKNVVIATF